MEITMPRLMSKEQAKTIIHRQEYTMFVLKALIALLLWPFSLTLAISCIACSLATSMRGIFLADGHTGPGVRIPATALAIALPWLFLIATGDYITQAELPRFLFVTLVPTFYFGLIRKDNPVYVDILTNRMDRSFLV